MPRVLLDLAEGRLSGPEADAVVAWLRASEDEPPPWLVERAVRRGRPALSADELAERKRA